MNIILDPGHGGKDPGAVGPTGLEEAEVAMDIASRLLELLEEDGHELGITRLADETIELPERMKLCKDGRFKPDLFISIHLNAAAASVVGTETIYAATSPASRKYAEAIQASMVKFLNSHDRGVKVSPSAGYPRDLYVLRKAPCPSVLVECEFISNPDKEAEMKTLEWVLKAATAIRDGVASVQQGN